MIWDFLWNFIVTVGPVFLGLLILAVSLLYIYYTWNFGFWEKQGVPTIKPVPFLGSRPYNYKEVPQLKDIEYRKKYGKIWGEYHGRDPFLFVCDPELVKEIMVKNFDCFTDRRFFDFGEAFENSLDMLPGEQWKTVRSLMTPGLSSGKIKHGKEIFAEKCKSMVDCMKKDAGKGKAVNIKNYFGYYGLDVIASYGFGLSVNTQEDHQHPFATNALKVLDPGEWGSPTSLMLEVAPWLAKFIGNVFDDASGKYFAKAASDIVQHRKNEATKREDFLGLLVKGIEESEINEDYKRLKITPRLLKNQCQLFLLAGFDTTRTTMSATSLCLALNPDKQRRVVEEVDAAIRSTNNEINHETIGKLPFLDACIEEALRLFPPLIRNERVATKDTEIAGIKVPKGVCVIMPAWGLARDPENFDNPDDFVPERFEKENRTHNQYAWTPFGHGPRACIGMRFAYEKMKYAFCYIFRELEFYKAPQTVDIKDVKCAPGSIFLITFTNITVGVRPRTDKN